MEQRRQGSAPATLHASVPVSSPSPHLPRQQSGPFWAIKGGSLLPTHPVPGCLPACVGSGSATGEAPPSPFAPCTVPAEKPLLIPAPPPLTGFLPRKESLGSLGSCSAHCNQLRVTGFPCSRGAGSMDSCGQPRCSPEVGPAALSKDPLKPKALHPHHKTRGHYQAGRPLAPGQLSQVVLRLWPGRTEPPRPLDKAGG